MMSVGKMVLGGLAVCLLARVQADPVVWTFPLKGCHEGLPFSDGRTGVLAWGGGDTLNLTFGRADLWDHRGGCSWLPGQSYTNIVALYRRGDFAALKALFKKSPKKGEPRNPRLLPLARVTLTLKGWALKSGALDPKTGCAEIVFADADGYDVVVPVAMSVESRTFAMKFPKGTEPQVSVRTSWSMRPEIARQLSSQGFAAPVEWAERPSSGFVWNLPADEPVSLGCTSEEGEFAAATERTSRRLRPKANFVRVKRETSEHWRRFWSRSATIEVPDEKIQQMYDFGLYKFGCMTDPDGIPAGLQGPWLEDDRFIPWNGDYHFNINVQECYAPAYRSGHLENLRPLFRMIRGWWPRLRENAHVFCGVEDGFVLPHSVDDRGTCIGGFWSGTIDHGSTAWVASMMFRYARYSRDLDFLKTDAYPFMKGAMKVYRTMMEERNGALSIPVGPSPETADWGPKFCVGANPSFQLAAAHRLSRDLMEASRMLGETPDPMWADVESQLPAFAAVDGRIGVWEDWHLPESHRHHSHMAGLYPFDTIDIEKNRPVVNGTYYWWVRNGFGNWSGWAFPWASVLHTHIGDADAAVWILKAWEAFFCNAGHGSRHDVYRPGLSVMRRGPNARAFGVVGDAAKDEEIMQMDAQCAAVAAILEMMVHEVNGKDVFFQGCPESWQRVSFRNVLLSNGSRVSGRRIDGVIKISIDGAGWGS